MNSEIIVLDDFLPKCFIERYHQKVTADDFKWFYLDNITRNMSPREYNCKGIEWNESDGLSHSIFYGNKWFDPYWALQYSVFICEAMSQKTGIDYDTLYRMKLNQTLSKGKELINMPHIDNTHEHTVLLYYVNDSDGDTILYDKLWDESHDNTDVELKVLERVTPKAGRAVIFNGLRYHSSSNPIKANKRIVLNINLGRSYEQQR